jgi:hypothetical protein
MGLPVTCQDRGLVKNSNFFSLEVAVKTVFYAAVTGNPKFKNFNSALLDMTGVTWTDKKQ